MTKKRAPRRFDEEFRREKIRLAESRTMPIAADVAHRLAGLPTCPELCLRSYRQPPLTLSLLLLLLHSNTSDEYERSGVALIG